MEMNQPSYPRFAYAGDRDIAVWVLEFILANGRRPQALLLSETGRASHAAELAAACPYLPGDHILYGNDFRSPAGLRLLEHLALDYIICVHFPYIIPPEVLALPREGVLNLHPAFLPYNRGWHTPSWAILEKTPAGATLHFMDEGVDTGDIVYQVQLDVRPADTAHTLYQRLKQLEFEVFVTAWPDLVACRYQRTRQSPESGTVHRRKDLLQPAVQRIDLEESLPVGELLRQLRALSTNSIEEAAYFEVDGRRYRVQVSIQEEPLTTG